MFFAIGSGSSGAPSISQIIYLEIFFKLWLTEFLPKDWRILKNNLAIARYYLQALTHLRNYQDTKRTMEDKEVQTDEKSIAKPSLRSSSVSEVRRKKISFLLYIIWPSNVREGSWLLILIRIHKNAESDPGPSQVRKKGGKRLALDLFHKEYWSCSRARVKIPGWVCIVIRLCSYGKCARC